MNSTTLDERKNKLFQGAFKFRWVKVNFSLFSLIWLSSPALKYHLNFFKIIFDSLVGHDVHVLTLLFQEVLFRDIQAVKQQYDLSVQKALAKLAESNHIQHQTRRIKLNLAISEHYLMTSQVLIDLKHSFGTSKSELKGTCVQLSEILSNSNC